MPQLLLYDFYHSDVLQDVTPGTNQGEKRGGPIPEVLTFISYIGAIISSVFLIITVITYILSKYVAFEAMMVAIMIVIE